MSTGWKVAVAAAAAVALTGVGFVVLADGAGRNGEGPPGELSGSAAEVVVFKTPACGCCAEWVEHLRAAGFEVEVRDQGDLSEVKRQAGVRPELASCHTAVVDGYVVEGHVPAADIRRLLEERPEVTGIAVPGMPMGSPGMEGPRTDPYDVLAFDRDGEVSVWESHR